MVEAKYGIAHFKRARIIISKNDEDVLRETYRNFVYGCKTVLKYLGLRVELPLFNIFIAPSRKEYDRFVAHLTKIPTSKGRVAQPQMADLYLLSPNAYPKDAESVYLGPNGVYDKGLYRRTVVHEAVHMAEEYLSPKGAMETRPQWWKEGLAVYVSGQYKKDRDIKELIKSSLDKIPDIRGVKGANSYVWGWSIIRYIETRFGKNKILNILEKQVDLDLHKTFKIQQQVFEKEWQKTARVNAREILNI